MAEALIDMRNSPYPILNLTHPRPVSWSNIITPVAELLNLPLFPFSDWLARLRGSAKDTTISEDELIKQNPGVMLLDFYRQEETATGGEKEAMGLRTMDTSKATEVASALDGKRLKELNEEDVKRWVGYWRKTRFLA